MNTKHPLGSLLGAATLAVLCSLLTGCGGPGKPAVDTYMANVTYASPDQAAADRQFIAKLFSDQAAQHGLVLEKPLPTDAVALYFPGPTGLNLSLSALNTGNKSIAISLIPVALGRKDNAGCRAVVTAVIKDLQQNFGARLSSSP